MIIVKLDGGLGNQMFQYAAARSLALRKNTDLCLDVSAFSSVSENKTPRNFQLNAFNIKVPFCAIDQKEQRNLSLIERLINKFKPYYRKQYYYEPFFHFDANFYNASSNSTLIGYWQSEKYFIDDAQVIRSDFLLKKVVSSETVFFEEKIKTENSVSMHLRRGDYVSNDAAASLLGALPLSYYEDAMRWIKLKVPEPHYYIFSDDPYWVRLNLNITNSTIVDTGNEITDFIAMSQCQHNIIANSSFSWWAAWLNANKNKRVIAPKNWFRDKTINTKDLIPSSWIRL